MCDHLLLQRARPLGHLLVQSDECTSKHADLILRMDIESRDVRSRTKVPGLVLELYQVRHFSSHDDVGEGEPGEDEAEQGEDGSQVEAGVALSAGDGIAGARVEQLVKLVDGLHDRHFRRMVFCIVQDATSQLRVRCPFDGELAGRVGKEAFDRVEGDAFRLHQLIRVILGFFELGELC